jgi:hypothetical protein
VGRAGRVAGLWGGGRGAGQAAAAESRRDARQLRKEPRPAIMLALHRLPRPLLLPCSALCSLLGVGCPCVSVRQMPADRCAPCFLQAPEGSLEGGALSAGPPSPSHTLLKSLSPRPHAGKPADDANGRGRTRTLTDLLKT